MEQLKQINAKFSAMSMREKVIVTLSAFAVCYLLLDMVLVTPSGQAQTIAEKQLRAIDKKVGTARAELELYQGIAKKDPNAKLTRERKKLQKELKEADAQLKELTLKLVPGSELPRMLADVLKVKGRLNLNSMQTLELSHLDVSGEEEEKPEIPELASSLAEELGTAEEQVLEEPVVEELPDKVYLYRHGVSMVVSGNFFDVLLYLSTLEQQDQRFYWEALDYQVNGYPEASVQIEVYTLSLEKGVLGG